MRAKTEAKAGAIQEAFVESFKQPIGFLLRHRAVRYSLLDACAQFSFTHSLDGIPNILQIDTSLFG